MRNPRVLCNIHGTHPRARACIFCYIYYIYIQCHVVRTYIYTTYRSPPRRRRRRRGGGMNSYGQGLSQDSWHTQAQGSWDGDYGDDQQEEYYDEF